MSLRQRHPTVRTVLLPDGGDPAARDDLFRNLRLANGTRKTTWAHRFEDLDEALPPLLGAPRPVRLLDVAVSSGVSTVELIDSLERHGHTVQADATDLTVRGSLWRVLPGLYAFTDDEGHVLQWDLLGIGLRGVGDGAARRVAGTGLAGVHAVSRRARIARAVADVDLVDPALVHRARVHREDLLDPEEHLRGPYDLVRACNILNRDYFDAPTLGALVSTLAHRVVDDGLLVIARTHADGRNHGTIYRRAAGELVVVTDLDGPADIDGLDVPGFQVRRGP